LRTFASELDQRALCGQRTAPRGFQVEQAGQATLLPGLGGAQRGLEVLGSGQGIGFPLGTDCKTASWFPRARRAASLGQCDGSS
jgi:hypothetical protein